MDLIKIGKYIAAKRKQLGLTQKQVADKLGMSDKSVSKWERGDSKYRQKKLKCIIVVLIVVILLVVTFFGAIAFRNLRQPQNYITAVERDSAEMKTAELLSGVDGALLFRYFTRDTFKTLTVFMSEYHCGKLIAKDKVADLAYEDLESTSDGMIVLVPDFEEFMVKLIITDSYAKYSATFPILENVENREYYGRSSTQIEEELPIQYDSEQGLAAFIYGENGVSGIPVQQIEAGEFPTTNEYVYYLSFQFGK